ncbi:hypothetical protein X943_000816 [Babesia divergens]|uniref:Uncharacterized protein n=1 Tax=Babesia divergens TaxID=32595 RepID=A0AAD9LK06_BABDI|nr:hypothetical protein X943_000816 [Babesia divergens]
MRFISWNALFLVIACIHVAGIGHNYKGSSTNTTPGIRWKNPQTQPFQCGALAFARKKHKYPHLLAFHKKDCEFCEDMEPLILRANKECDVHIERLDVGYNHNYALMLKLDKRAKCGGLPFYYNLLTHRHICGATTYQNLVAWATGKRSSSILPSPLKSEEIKASYRRTGLYARIMGKLRDVCVTIVLRNRFLDSGARREKDDRPFKQCLIPWTQ